MNKMAMQYGLILTPICFDRIHTRVNKKLSQLSKTKVIRGF